MQLGKVRGCRNRGSARLREWGLAGIRGEERRKGGKCGAKGFILN